MIHRAGAVGICVAAEARWLAALSILIVLDLLGFSLGECGLLPRRSSSRAVMTGRVLRNLRKFDRRSTFFEVKTFQCRRLPKLTIG